ncbi:MAG: MFS transporter [Bacilli bacterium]|nr:MFS transporter [Bacilli bacterium]
MVIESQEVRTALREEKPVKTSSAVWLGVANSATGLLCAFAEGTALTYFFTTFMGLNPNLSAIVWIIFGIWNALNDPIYGFIADRTKSKLGRRIPWIRYGAPIMAVLFAITWISFPSMKGNQAFLFCQMLISLFLYDIVYTAIASAIYVMPYEMAVTNKARNKIFIWNIVFSLVNFGAPMFLNGMLTDLIEGNPTMFTIGMAIAGVVAGALTFISTFFYKENGYHMEEEQPKFFEGLKQCLKNKPFLLFEVISWTVIYAQQSLMLGLTYVNEMWYNSGVNGWAGGMSMWILYGGLALGLLAGILFFVFTRPKFGIRTDTLIMCAVMGTGVLVGSFLGKYMYVLVFSFFCIGVGLGGGLYLVPMLNGDIIDFDELKNGARREGVYAGINSLITKPAGALAQAIFPVMMAWFGFDQNKKTAQGITDFVNQPQSAKDGLFICWFLITGILLILSLVAMWFFPLHGKKWDDEKSALADAHAKKEQEYEQAILAKMEADQAKAE